MEPLSSATPCERMHIQRQTAHTYSLQAITDWQVRSKQQHIEGRVASPELRVALDELQGSLLVCSAGGKELHACLRLHYLGDTLQLCGACVSAMSMHGFRQSTLNPAITL